MELPPLSPLPSCFLLALNPHVLPSYTMSNFHHLPDLRKLHISNAANGKAISPNLRTRGVGPSMAGALSPVMDRSRAAPPIVAIPEDIENAPAGDPPMDRLRTYVKSLPYAVESNA